MDQELVVLVDEQDRQIGTVAKSAAHHKETPLHRAFSAYVFTPKGKVLVSRRAKSKITWPGFWATSYCGHPRPEESREEALVRRGREELGVQVRDCIKAADYRYRFEVNGIAENEICPVYVGLADTEQLERNPAEAEDAKWVEWSDYLQEIEERSEEYAPWTPEQVALLKESPVFKEWLERHNIALI